MMFASDVNTVNLSKLEKSVGKDGSNLPLDVLVIQRLLNGTTKKYTGKKSLVPDGFYGTGTQEQIKLFQKNVMGYAKPDSLISVDRGTHTKLVETIDPAYLSKQKMWAMLNQKYVIDIDQFITLFKKQYPTDKNTSHLKILVQSILNDASITDLRWVAYMLATVRRECDSKWQPIEEYRKGKGLAYDVEVEVTDPVTKKKHKNVYYGRGYVQLTWDVNYKKVGKLLGVGEKYYINPEKVLKHDDSYKIMSLGMRTGVFTGLKLTQFLSGMKTDYVGARKIINGTDHDVEIARYAVTYEALLKASVMKQGDYQVGSYANYA